MTDHTEKLSDANGLREKTALALLRSASLVLVSITALLYALLYAGVTEFTGLTWIILVALTVVILAASVDTVSNIIELANRRGALTERTGEQA